MPYDASGIEVIGAGLGRTGTKSLQAALDRLGFKTYHFPLPSHAEKWAHLADGNVSIDEVLEMVVSAGFTATCDQPAADFYAEQLRKYPNAKVILTVRDDGQKWAASWKILMRFIEVQERPFSLWYPTFIQWIPFMRAWKRMRNVIGTHLGLPPGQLIRGWSQQPNPEEWLATQYEAHNGQVQATVPPHKLLVFNVKEGWEPLCAFLGKDVPTEPFPFVNESADLKMAMRMQIALSYAWLPLMAVSVEFLRAFFRRLK